MAMFDHNDTWLYSFISVLLSCINEIKVKDDFFLSFFCTRKCYLIVSYCIEIKKQNDRIK